jgi:uncharacterized protein YkwD
MTGVVYGNNWWNLLCFLLLILSISCSSEEVEKEISAIPFPAYSSIELEVLDLVNGHRSSIGGKELIRLEEISLQALSHTEHMIEKQEVCHHNFGSRYHALIEKVGAKAMGENVGYGYRTSEAFLGAWLHSANHRKTIEGEHTHFGISAKEGKENIYVTLIFIRK